MNATHGEPFAEPVYVTRPLLPDLDAYVEKLREIWTTGRVANFGPFHDRLEALIGDRLGTKNVSLWSNGTIALLGAIRGLDLSGEVITTPFTFPATVHALAWMGVTPVFADIDPVALTIDPERVEELVTDRTSAILGVHVYGHWCDSKALAEVAGRHDLAVVYDGAHAFGVQPPDGDHAFGDVTMFSFHPTKIFHTGEGAALVARDADLDLKLKLHRNFGIAGEEEMPEIGINGKLNELQAALGLLLLDEVESEIERRREVAGWYVDGLRGAEGISVFSGAPDDTSHQYFVVLVDEGEAGLSRDDVHRGLRDLNVHARRYFSPLCSQLAAYRDLPSARPELLPHAERAATECLALPFHGALARETVERICASIVSMQRAAGAGR